MQNQNLSYIYSAPASGKSVLTRLLDGHPELAVTPTHDILPQLYFSLDSNYSIKKHRLFYELRKHLNKTRYYRIEDIAHHRGSNVTTSIEDLNFEFTNINFYDLEREWTNKISTGDLSPETIIKNIFSSLYNNWSDYPYDKSKCQYFVGMGSTKYPSPMEKMLKQDDDSKIIFIKRDPRAIVASKGGREYSSNSITDIIKRGRIYNIRKLFHEIDNLEQQYPSNVLVINFKTLILNHKKVMQKIALFLNIEENEILYHPTYCGEKLHPKNNYVGEIKDNWKQLLSSDQRCAVDLQAGRLPNNITIGGIKLYIDALTNVMASNTFERSKEAIKRVKD